MKPVKRTVQAIAMASLLAPAAVSAETVKMKFSSNGAPGDSQTVALRIMKEYIESVNPDFQIKVFDSATLIKQGQQTQALARGTVDVAWLAPTWIAKKLPAWDILATPYLLTGPEHVCAVWNSDVGKTMVAEVKDSMKAVVLGMAYQGARTLNLRDVKDIKTPADMKGVKFRVVPSPSNIAMGKALGANPTPVAFKELYLALQTGTVDGQDNPLPITYKNKFYEVTKQIVLTRHKVLTLMPTVSEKAWNGLSDADKRLFQRAGELAVRYFTESVVLQEGRLVEVLKGKGMTFTTPDREAFRQAALDYFQKSEFAEKWKPGMFDQIKNMSIPASCKL